MKTWQKISLALGTVAVATGLIYYVGKSQLESEARSKKRKKKSGSRQSAEGDAHPADQETEQEDDSRINEAQRLIRTAEELCEAKSFREAQEYFKTAISKLLSVDGGETMVTAFLRFETAMTSKELGEYDVAAQEFSKAIEYFESVLAGKSQSEDAQSLRDDARAHVVRSLVELSDCLCLQSRLVHPTTADQLLQRAKDESAKALKHAAPYETSAEIKEKMQYAYALKSVIQAYMFTKEWDAAEAQALRCLALLRPILQHNDSMLFTIGMWLTQIYLGQDKFKEACDESKTLLEMAEGAEMEKFFLQYCGELFSDCKRYAEAEGFFIRLLKSVGGDVGASTQQSDADGDARRTDPVFGELFTAAVERFGALSGLASTYIDAGRTKDAIAPLRELEYLLVNDTSIDPPLATTKYFRTKGARVDSQNNDNIVVMNTLIRQRNSLTLPIGSVVQFCTYNVPFSALSDEEIIEEFTKPNPVHRGELPQDQNKDTESKDIESKSIETIETTEQPEKSSKELDKDEQSSSSEKGQGNEESTDDDTDENNDDNDEIAANEKEAQTGNASDAKHERYQLTEMVFAGNTKFLVLQSEPLTVELPVVPVVIRVLNPERSSVNAVHVQFVRNIAGQSKRLVL